MPDESPVGGSSPQSPAEAVSTPAQPEVRSLEQPTQDFTAKVNEAKSPREMQNLIAEARKQGLRAPTKADEKPMGEKPKADPTPDLQAAAAKEETPAETPETPAEEQPAAEETPEGDTPAESPEEADEPIPDGPVTPSQAKKLRLRLPEDDKVGRLAAAFMQRNRDMGMEAALAKAREQLGIKPDSPKTETPSAPKSDLPETIEAVDTTLESLDAERDKAFTELRFEDVAKIDRKIRTLDRHRMNLERDGERKQTKAVQEYHAQFAQSEAKAAELYADASKADSPFGKRMAEIDADLEANGDPLFNAPDKPLRIAQMVARELNIAPRKKGTPATPAKAAAPAITPPKPKMGVVPSGASRTTPPAVNQKPAIISKVESVSNLRDLRNLRKELGLPN